MENIFDETQRELEILLASSSKLKFRTENSYKELVDKLYENYSDFKSNTGKIRQIWEILRHIQKNLMCFKFDWEITLSPQYVTRIAGLESIKKELMNKYHELGIDDIQLAIVYSNSPICEYPTDSIMLDLPEDCIGLLMLFKIKGVTALSAGITLTVIAVEGFVILDLWKRALACSDKAYPLEKIEHEITKEFFKRLPYSLKIPLPQIGSDYQKIIGEYIGEQMSIITNNNSYKKFDSKRQFHAKVPSNWDVSVRLRNEWLTNFIDIFCAQIAKDIQEQIGVDKFSLNRTLLDYDTVGNKIILLFHGKGRSRQCINIIGIKTCGDVDFWGDFLITLTPKPDPNFCIIVEHLRTDNVDYKIAGDLGSIAKELIEKLTKYGENARNRIREFRYPKHEIINQKISGSRAVFSYVASDQLVIVLRMLK